MVIIYHITFFFLVPAISLLSAIQDPVLSSIASRIVSEDEQGRVIDAPVSLQARQSL